MDLLHGRHPALQAGGAARTAGLAHKAPICKHVILHLLKLGRKSDEPKSLLTYCHGSSSCDSLRPHSFGPVGPGWDLGGSRREKEVWLGAPALSRELGLF